MQHDMAEGPFGARRPRPVADVPPAALADGAAPAKGWLLALVAASDLSAAAALPTADLAREGPLLCAAVLRAVGSDAELARLEPGGDLEAVAARVGALAGAAGPAEAAAAVGHLRGALWTALAAELRDLDAGGTAALAERLGWVCDVVTAAALRGAGTAPRAARPAPPEAAPGPQPLRAVEPDPLQALGDELRGEAREGEGAWIVAVERRLARHAADGRPFAVLAVEADDAERLLAADREGAAAVALAQVEQAVREAVRDADTVLREGAGRVWVIAPDLAATGARALGEALAEAVARTAVLAGTPLTVSIGLAICPEDGRDAAPLIAHADEGLFAARAAGVRLA